MASRPLFSVGYLFSLAVLNLLTPLDQMFKSNSGTQSTNNEVAEKELQAAVKEFKAALKKNTASYHEPSSFAAVIDVIKHSNSIDDRKMALEHLLSFISRNADGPFKNQMTELQNLVIELLSIPTARRLLNNPADPDAGKAGTPYGRSVQQMQSLPANMLPDPGLVFDTLLRREKFVRHPAGFSSMFFSWAALVVHSLFRTSHEPGKVYINETSSYADLAPLYGNDEATQRDLRVNDGRGLLHPDSFAEERLLMLPPAVCALLVLFNRNHNYIASKLLEINERGSFTNPDRIPLGDPGRAKKIEDQDQQIFQTARLINCTWFGGIIFSDYVSSILGLVRQGSTWSLNPFNDLRGLDHKLFERGRGNACSVEFNCIYRWHATTSQADDQWTSAHMSQLFPGKDLENITPNEFRETVGRLFPKKSDLSQWTFGGLKRGPDGRFNDSELAALIKDAITHPAATFGARGTPHSLKVIEVMGIEASRRWGVCSLNELRKFIGLKPYASFLEWNDDPEIAEAAERLYTHIDNLELYVGLQAEQVKPVVDGAGLCPGMFNSRYLWAETNSFLVGYTISRAILSDAIALTRGDRFLTTDLTPYNLTSWGLADSQRDRKGPGNGGMLGRLILRALPREFTENSTYTWFPLQTPESMEVFLNRLGTSDRYSFTRPGSAPVVVNAMEYNTIQNILGNNRFVHRYGEKAACVVSGEGFFLATRNAADSQRDQRELLRLLLSSPEQADNIAHYFYEKTRKLIVKKSFKLFDNSVRFVDIVRDVLRYVPLHWAATELAGLTLKADEDSLGDYTESQLYEMITEIYSFLFLDVDPSQAMNLEARVKEHIKDLQHRIKANLLLDAGKLGISGLVESIQSLFVGKSIKEKFSLADSRYESGASIDRTTNNVLSLLVGASVELSQSIINIVNFYLDLPDAVLQLKAAVAGNSKLEGYAYEAMRIDPPFRGVYRESLADQTVGSLTLSKGQRVFLDLAHASLDSSVFTNPMTVEVNREPKSRYLFDDIITRSLGVELAMKITGQMLRAVFEFDGMRRGPSASGTLKRYKVAVENMHRYEYLGANHLPTVWPNTMLLQYNIAVAQGYSTRA
ncbi:linoleate diol synthase [Lactifluus volemus]|nr:linoleate diol synthase [Lactifluus volemus]